MDSAIENDQVGSSTWLGDQVLVDDSLIGKTTNDPICDPAAGSFAIFDQSKSML